MDEPDFYLGETWLIPGTARDRDGKIINLTGSIVSFRLFTSTGTALDVVTGDGIQVDDPETGNYLIIISPEKQLSLNTKVKNYSGEVKIALPNGYVSIQGRKSFTVNASSFRRWA